MSAQGARGQKRRKVSLACVECRERKRKCDGERPSCGNCAKRKPPAECVYTDETLKRGSSGYVEALRTRIKELEEQVQTQTAIAPVSPPITEGLHNLTFRSGISSVLSSQSSAPNTTHGQTPFQRQFEGTAWKPQPAQPSPSSYLALPAGESSGTASTPKDEEHQYSGIGSMGTPWGSLCYHCRGRRVHNRESFDSTNAADFDHQIREWTAGASDDVEKNEESIKRPVKICRCWAGHKMNIARAAARWTLPDRSQADAFVDNYFEMVYTLYPYVIRPAFMHNYSQVWQPRLSAWNEGLDSSEEDADSDIFFCLLNAMFALGVQFDTTHDAKWKASMGQLFYHRVLAALKFNGLERGTIELVQTLILTAQYLQATQLWEACWNFTGLAIRVAQGIGLHIKPTNTEIARRHASFVLEEAMRRRTWAGCVSLDRMLALLYGKPQMLHPTLTRNFLDTLPYRSDEAIMANSDAVIHRPHMIEFFNHTLKQLHLLGQVMNLSYSEGVTPATYIIDEDEKSSQSDVPEPRSEMTYAHLQEILKLDVSLVKLNTQVPKHLDFISSNPGTVFGRQARLTRIRYLHIRVYLLRPVLLELYRYVSNQTPSAELKSVQISAHIETLKTMARNCLDGAMAMIGCIFDDEFSRKPASNLWWYGIYYCYFCAAVLHAGRLCTRLTHVQDDASLQESFQKCLHCLQKYEVHGTSAKICRSALELLEKRAFPTQDTAYGRSAGILADIEAPLPASIDASYSTYQQYPAQPDYSAMQGGWFGGVEPAGLIGTDAENYFWTTFMPNSSGPNF